MSSAPATAALIFVGFAVAVAGLYAWLVTGARAALTWNLLPEPLAGGLDSLLRTLGFSSRLPLVAWNARRPVPWALTDLLAILGLQLIAGELAHRFGLIPEGQIEDLSVPQRETLVTWNVGLSLLLAVVSVLLVMVRTRATPHDLGWSWRNLRHDIRLGLAGFVMLAPPVYAVQGLLVSFWKESKHPIVEMFKAAPDAPFFGVLLLSAAIVAPLFEELMFRVLLQGFLEKVFSFRGEIRDLLLGALPGSAARPSELQPELRGAAAWLPIAVSSTIFALLHYSHGPDWVPLLLLAAGMGYLYQRTHRLLPSLIVHSLLNGLSMWGLWVSIKEGALTS